jgi:hypothetical protein
MQIGCDLGEIAIRCNADGAFDEFANIGSEAAFRLLWVNLLTNLLALCSGWHCDVLTLVEQQNELIRRFYRVFWNLLEALK